jgi:starch synthase
MAETVGGCSPELSACLGFVFEQYDAGELLRTLKEALTAFKSKSQWRKLMVRAMQADFSWKPSVPKYEILYEKTRGKGSR